MESLLNDFRFGVRMLRKAPGFTAVAVVVLALGIGANTAIFSVVNAVLLRPLPFRDAERLVQVWHVPPAKSFPGMTQFSVSPANYLDWEKQNHVFEQMAIYRFLLYNLTGTGEPESVSASWSVAGFFLCAQGRAAAGTRFSCRRKTRPGHGHVVVLSQTFWQTHFASDPNIVGRKISLE